MFVTRAFVQQRAILAAHSELALQVASLEKKLLAGLQIIREHDDRLDASEAQIEALIEAIRALQTPPAAPRRAIGFRTGDGE